MNTITSEPKIEKKRMLFIDILKTIAIFGVLIIHFTPRAYTEYSPYSFQYIFTVFINCLVRFSVPVFVMCSGTLFLDDNKSVSVRSIYKKYIPRIVIALFIFAVIYEGFSICCSFLNTGVWDTAFFVTALKNLLTFNTHFHLYYLYIIIILYALTPTIKLFLKSARKRDIEYIILFIFITSIFLPFLRNFYPLDRYFGGMTFQYSLNLVYSLIVYYILGYYLNKFPPEGKKFILTIALGILSVFITFFGTTNRLIESGSLSEIYLQGTSPTVFFMSTALFSSAKKLSKNISEHSFASRIFKFISKVSFTIYLVHECFNILFEKLGFTIFCMNPLISLPLLLISNTILSSLAYLILRKIPGIKSIL